MTILRTLPLVMLFSALTATPSWSKTVAPLGVLTGDVVGVMDGDTLDLLVDKRPVRIRLANVDAPEKAQPHGQASKKALVGMALGKTCSATVQVVDRYGRKVAELECGAGQVNRMMVEQGAAWTYTAYNRDPILPGVQARAKEANRGLWALQEDQRVPPWLWRHPDAAPAKPKSECATLKCSGLHSCADALNALQRCPASRLLDGDRDGKPCEELCR